VGLDHQFRGPEDDAEFEQPPIADKRRALLEVMGNRHLLTISCPCVAHLSGG
jgi:hypothetical protein